MNMRAILFVLFLSSVKFANAQTIPPEKANEWYARQPWLVGCNFIPSTAINQLEMWQEETFDTTTINRELALAASVGMNIVRVYLHDLAYEADKEGFKQRINTFLELATRHGIITSFVIFDDCWQPDPKIGKQPEPIPGVHNSGWMQSPHTDIANDTRNRTEWGRLEAYVKDILTTFSGDERILYWDLYNEPSPRMLHGTKALPLLKEVFKWAREAHPSQPLTSGIYFKFKRYNKFQLNNSDIITFHNYYDAENLQKQIKNLKQIGRPVICTEWMARTRDSKIETHLPIFKAENVGCIMWGLVSGKTQTIYSWRPKVHTQEPELWFHDLFYPDGKPYKESEVELFRKLTGKE
jgi:endo-1,4-beta-mannosidase